MQTLQRKYWLFLLLNLVINAFVLYTAVFGIITIFLFIMVITVIGQVKVTLKINNPNLAVHKPRTGLMYFVLSILTLIPIGESIFIFPYLNNWLIEKTGYLHFIYAGKFILIPIGIISFGLAVMATIMKINELNREYFIRLNEKDGGQK